MTDPIMADLLMVDLLITANIPTAICLQMVDLLMVGLLITANFHTVCLPLMGDLLMGDPLTGDLLLATEDPIPLLCWGLFEPLSSYWTRWK
jgi:hypothetical protein